jgi:ribosomal protein L20
VWQVKSAVGSRRKKKDILEVVATEWKCTPPLTIRAAKNETRSASKGMARQKKNEKGMARAVSG